VTVGDDGTTQVALTASERRTDRHAEGRTPPAVCGDEELKVFEVVSLPRINHANPAELREVARRRSLEAQQSSNNVAAQPQHETIADTVHEDRQSARPGHSGAHGVADHAAIEGPEVQLCLS
jgi:hypothetical protein